MNPATMTQPLLYLALALTFWSLLGIVSRAEARHHRGLGSGRPRGETRLAGDDEVRSVSTSDGQIRDSCDQSWDETIRAACRVIADAPGRVKSIHIVGETWTDVAPGRLQRFIDLAQAAASDFGVAATVGYEHGHPCLHLVRRKGSVKCVNHRAGSETQSV